MLSGWTGTGTGRVRGRQGGTRYIQKGPPFPIPQNYPGHGWSRSRATKTLKDISSLGVLGRKFIGTQEGQKKGSTHQGRLEGVVVIREIGDSIIAPAVLPAVHPVGVSSRVRGPTPPGVSTGSTVDGGVG